MSKVEGLRAGFEIGQAFHLEILPRLFIRIKDLFSLKFRLDIFHTSDNTSIEIRDLKACVDFSSFIPMKKFYPCVSVCFKILYFH